ncbi:MAG: hypothetical protein E6Q36_02880 [Chryseobacterium sp.]|nr:MAG: hypothetical protein E6Q36_02880 [Chryseobacterium sp.]
MVSTFSNQMIAGRLRQVQTLQYSNGITSKRIFENPGDTIPMEVIWVATSSVRVKPEQVLVSRHFKSLHGEG